MRVAAVPTRSPPRSCDCLSLTCLAHSHCCCLAAPVCACSNGDGLIDIDEYVGSVPTPQYPTPSVRVVADMTVVVGVVVPSGLRS